MDPVTITILLVAGAVAWKSRGATSTVQPANDTSPAGGGDGSGSGVTPPPPGENWAPGVYPAPPWAADTENPNAADCGSPGENANANLARYLSSQYRISLPADIQSQSVARLTNTLQQIVTKNRNNYTMILDIDARTYRCIGLKAWRGLLGAPNKLQSWGQQQLNGARDSAQQASDKVTSVVKGWGL